MVAINSYSSFAIICKPLLLVIVIDCIFSNLAFYRPSCRRYYTRLHDDDDILHNSDEIECINDPYDQCMNMTYPSHTWVEVTRLSISKLIKRSIQKSIIHRNWINSDYHTYGWMEGWSTGFPASDINNRSHVPYGCWFYISPGSGIYVNIGHTLVSRRDDLFFTLSLHKNGCLMSRSHTKSKRNDNNNDLNDLSDSSSDDNYDSSLLHDGTIDNNYQCIDKYFCTRAMELGYNSIQIIDRKELVICHQQCSSVSYDGACPPIELRTNHASDICHCSEEISSRGELNCDLNRSTEESGDDYTIENVKEGNRDSGRCIDDSSQSGVSTEEGCSCISGSSYCHSYQESSTRGSSSSSSRNSSSSSSRRRRDALFELTIAVTTNLLAWDKRNFDKYYRQFIYTDDIASDVSLLLLLDLELTYTSSEGDKHRLNALIDDKDLVVLHYGDIVYDQDDSHHHHHHDHHVVDQSHNPSFLYITNIEPTVKTSRVFNVNGLLLGIINYNPPIQMNSHELHKIISWIIDEATILQATYHAQVVLLISYIDYHTISYISTHTKGYIDAVISGYDQEIATCYGKYYQGSSNVILHAPTHISSIYYPFFVYMNIIIYPPLPNHLNHTLIFSSDITGYIKVN